MDENKYAETPSESLLQIYVQMQKTLAGWFPGPRQADYYMRSLDVKREILKRMG